MEPSSEINNKEILRTVVQFTVIRFLLKIKNSLITLSSIHDMFYTQIYISHLTSECKYKVKKQKKTDVNIHLKCNSTMSLLHHKTKLMTLLLSNSIEKSSKRKKMKIRENYPNMNTVTKLCWNMNNIS